jgi:hypothetical protein
MVIIEFDFLIPDLSIAGKPNASLGNGAILSEEPVNFISMTITNHDLAAITEELDLKVTSIFQELRVLDRTPEAEGVGEANLVNWAIR